MFAIGGAILGILFYIINGFIQILFYKISFNLLFKIELGSIFEEINTKKVISNSLWIVYLLHTVIAFIFMFISKIFEIDDRDTSSSIDSLLHTIPFFVLFYFHWKEFTLKDDSENTITKAFIVFYFAILPYALMILLLLLFSIVFIFFF